MSFETAIEKLTAAIEAATGVLVATGAGAAPRSEPKTATVVSTNGAAKPKPAAKVEEPDDDGGLGDDDDALGGDAGPTAESAKAAVFAYRDKAIALLGSKEEALSSTRALMRKHVQSVDEIDDSNAAAVEAAFTAAMGKLKAKK